MHPLTINQYVDFDSMLDIDGLTSMHGLLLKAIADSPWYIGANANGREDGLIDVGQYERMYQEDPVLKEEVHGLTFDGRNKYFLLKHNAGQLGYAVRVVMPRDYLTKHDPEQCYPVGDISKFNPLLDWIKQQNIFTMFGRVVIFITPAGLVHPAHHDYKKLGLGSRIGRVDEFLWLRTSKSKSFGLYDNSTPRQFNPIESYTAWFNNDQYHGGPPHPAEEWSFSVRIDGVFSDSFRQFAFLQGK